MIYILKIPREINFENLTGFIKNLSEDRKCKIARLENENAKIVSVLTEIFLRKVISVERGISPEKIEFSYNNYGKPYLKNKISDELQFSVSHSGEIIVIATSGNEVGIDVEKINFGREKFPLRYFTENERNSLENSNDKIITFYEIFTKKEAFAKKIGKGFKLDFKSFDVVSSNEVLSKNYSDFIISIAGENLKDFPQEKYVSLDFLFEENL